MKPRNHNEWFRPIDRPKHCPHCGAHAQVWTWGEYVRAKWRNVDHFCQHCFARIREQLNAHAGPCGCTITLVGYHCELPAWLTLKTEVKPCADCCGDTDCCSGHEVPA